MVEEKNGEFPDMSLQFACSADNLGMNAIDRSKQLDLGIMNFLPLYVETVLQDPRVNRKKLQPIIDLCQKLSNFPNLHFFSQWSPRSLERGQKVSLSNAIITTTEGEAKNAVDDNATTCWSFVASTWTVKFPQPTDLDGIKIAWTSPQHPIGNNKKFPVGAPKQFGIFATFPVVDPQTGTTSESTFIHIQTFEPETERKLQRSWVQTYRIYLKNVSSIKLLFSRRLCSESNAKSCTIYDISCFQRFDMGLLWVEDLKLFDKIQQSLFLGIESDLARSYALSASFNMIRCTGSLKSLLFCVRHFLADPSKCHKIQKTICLDNEVSTSESFAASECILRTIHEKENELQKLYNELNCVYKECVLKNVSFFTESKSPNLTLVNNLEVKVDDWKDGYCILGYQVNFIQSVCLQWEIEIQGSEVDHNFLKGIRVGLIALSSLTGEISNDIIDNNSYLIDAGTGELYGKSSVPVPNKKLELPLEESNPIRRITFTYEQRANQLSIAINDHNYGVIFENFSSSFALFPFIRFMERQQTKSNEEVLTAPSEVIRLKSFSSIKNPKSVVQPLPFRTFEISETFNTRELAILMLKKVSMLSSTLSRCQAYPVSNQLSGKFEFPYCLELSVDVFTHINEILKVGIESQDDSIIVPTLQVLEMQLSILIHSKLSLESIECYRTGLIRFDAHKKESELRTLTALRKQMEGLLFTSNESTSMNFDIIAICFTRLMKLSIRSMVDCVVVINSLFHEESNMSDTSKFALFGNILSGICDPKSVSLLVSSLHSCDSSAHQSLQSFLSILFELIYFVEKEAVSTRTYFIHYESFTSSEKGEFVKNASSFLNLFFEEIVLVATASNRRNEIGVTLRTYTHFFNEYLKHSLLFLKDLSYLETSWVSGWELELFAKQGYLLSALHPYFYSLAVEGLSVEFIESVVENAQSLVVQSLLSLDESSFCKRVLQYLSTLPLFPLTFTPAGWREVKGRMDESESEDAFMISRDGRTYASTKTNTRTCCFVNYRFTKWQRGAWEFELIEDRINDEGSLFGAVRLPLQNRNYKDSRDMWMLRSYNGGIISQGNETNSSIGKVHKGDKIRIEWNGPEGTLSFSVNGKVPVIGASCILNDIYPACGSYSAGLEIKLTKLEVYSDNCVDESTNDDDYTPSRCCSWLLPESFQNVQDTSVLVHSLSGATHSKWITARVTKGALHGVHEWEFQFFDSSEGFWSIGFVIDHIPPNNERLASVQPEAKNGNGITSFAWNCDGSLWCNGEKISSSYGRGISLRKYSTVKLRINRFDSTVSYFVDGKYLGIACGPENVHGATRLADQFPSDKVIFPAASISGSKFSLKVKPAGMESSAVVPFLYSFVQSATSVLGYICGQLIQGSDINKNEQSLTEWLRSSIFAGGIDISYLNEITVDALPDDFLTVLKGKILEIAQDDGEWKGNLIPSEKFLLDISRADKFDQKNAPVLQFYDWLESIDAEPPAMRRVLERNGNFRFPICELPFIACLLKQAGLTAEAFSIYQSLSSEKTQVASEEMFLLWKKVKQLRTSLRRKKQQLKLISFETDSEPLPRITETSCDQINQMKDAFKIEFGSDAVWKSRADWTVQNTAEGLIAKVLCFCWQPTSSCLLLCVEVSSQANIPIAINFSNCLLTVDSEDVDDCVLFDQQNLGTVVRSLFSFDLSHLHSSLLKNLETFQFKIDPSWDPITVEIAGQQTSKSLLKSKDFESFCRSIAAKAQFLLLMKSAVLSSDPGAKTKLLGLSALSSGSFTKNHHGGILRQSTQDRWRSVVEFLQVHKSIRKQLSIGRTEKNMKPGIDDFDLSFTETEFSQPKADNISTAQAVIQACSVFVYSDDSACSIEELCNLMKFKFHRASTRIHAFNMICTTLQSRLLVDDPHLLFQYLAILKTFIPPNSSYHSAKEFGSQSYERRHYLVNLEGCSSVVLEHVQNAFVSVYRCLADTFQQYLNLWELSYKPISSLKEDSASYPPRLLFQLLLMILKMWTIEFSNRDYAWVVKSSILPALFKVISFITHESHVKNWYSCILQLLLTKPASPLSLLNAEIVDQGIQDESLSGRELLFHLYQFASSQNFPPEKLQQYGLDKPFHEVFDCSSASETASHIYSLLRISEADMGQNKLDIHEFQMLYPIGLFHAEHHAPRIMFTENYSVASFTSNGTGTPSCAYCSIEYDLRNPSEAKEKGNYFEVRILASNGAIAIGLADRNVFPVTQNIPGLIPHSYAYHGDDGKKYGVKATSGIFSMFKAGDVIGCGINFDSKTIFYTKNGAFLGDAFVGIEEDVITPVIGFTNVSGENYKVKINFGVESFLFDPSSLMNLRIIPNPNALRERETRREKLPILASAEELLASQNANADLLRIKAHLSQYSVLRTVSLELIRYFLLLTSEISSHSVEVSSHKDYPNHDKLKLFIQPPIMKNFSTFGTPHFMTKAAQSKIQSHITSALMHEVYIGSLYLNQCYSKDVKKSSFSALEERVLVDESIQTGNDIALIERKEVIQILCQHLLSLSLIMNSNPDIRDELSHSNAISVFLSLFATPVPQINYLILRILMQLLPGLDPEVVEVSIPELWRKRIFDYRNMLRDWQCPMEETDRPDSFIYMLLLDSVSFINPLLYSVAINAYGYGDFLVRSAQLKSDLLRKLFETSQWTEIVAAKVTAAYQNAGFIIGQPILGDTVHIDPAGGEKIISCAIAACGIFTPFPSLYPGSKVMVSNMKGTVIGAFDSDSSTNIVLDANLGHFSCRKNVETVKRDDVTQSTIPPKFDLTAVSPSMLMHLHQLTKQLLIYTTKSESLFQDPSSRLKLMLLSMVLASVSWFIQSQSEEVYMPDSDMLKELICFSATTLTLPNIITLSDLWKVWLFVQTRTAERFMNLSRRSIDDEHLREEKNDSQLLTEESSSNPCLGSFNADKNVLKGIELEKATDDECPLHFRPNELQVTNMKKYADFKDVVERDVFIIETEENGLIPFGGFSIGTTRSKLLSIKRSLLQAKFYNSQTGEAYFKTLNWDSCGLIHSFHYPVLSHDFQQSTVHLIDFSLAILSSRNLLKQLFKKDYLERFMPKWNQLITNPVHLIKLLCCTTNSTSLSNPVVMNALDIFSKKIQGSEMSFTCISLVEDIQRQLHLLLLNRKTFQFSQNGLKQNLNVQFHDEFELIWPSKAIENSNTFSLIPKKVWIWRAKADGEYRNVSDVVTTTRTSPRRALLVDSRQCKPPLSFTLVWFSGTHNLAVWRLNPPEGYVAVGDIISNSSSPPSPEGFLCIPKWAVKKCECTRYLMTLKEVTGNQSALFTNLSIFKTDHDLGYFYGICNDDISTGFTIAIDNIDSLVLAEWRNESDIDVVPSLTWSLQLLKALITSAEWKHTVINVHVLKSLLHYLLADRAISRLEIINLLILLIRQAMKDNIPISVDEINSLRDSIINTSINSISLDMIPKEKKPELSFSLKKLMDFVFEVQTIKITQSRLKEHQALQKGILNEALHKDSDFLYTYEDADESKEEKYFFEEKVDSEIDITSSQKTLNWWDRSHHRKDPHLRFHRLLKIKLIKYPKTPIDEFVSKLNEVLKFLHSSSSQITFLSKNASQSASSFDVSYFPKLLLGKIWLHNLSLSQFIQSRQHPYQEKTGFTKSFYFPGAKSLRIVFDRRTALNAGDKLTFRSGSISSLFTHPISENLLKQGINFISDEFTLIFEKNEPSKESFKSLEQVQWGWAFVVIASPSLYEAGRLTLNIGKLAEKMRKKTSFTSTTATKATTTITTDSSNAIFSPPPTFSFALDHGIPKSSSFTPPLAPPVPIFTFGTTQPSPIGFAGTFVLQVVLCFSLTVSIHKLLRYECLPF